ncbi:hypothetical protein FQ087_02920 [Sporosarcina sp. ANT_H38]|uniref:hypothetical protein n=1 Tax=Sporosarcina sp. ANT_H38 TaxID=2597358 RepID=UPI0011F10FC9|nr:hypothetical protein [Sporosarcina sp. ANT_H38]KAA0965277.1 hypothetical protein FQ087_02920 [Sporosarcina sp. ANT_H38]
MMGIQREKETKREKSLRLMEKRIVQACRTLEKISNLSTAHYSYTEEELDSMISVLESKSSYAVECLKRRKELNRKP